jgi:hypothetical protein
MSDKADIEGVFYERLTVAEGLGDIKLDEWKIKKDKACGIRYVTLEHIQEKTEAYLEKESVQRSIKTCAKEMFNAVQAR